MNQVIKEWTYPSFFCLQVVPASVQRNRPNVNAYISLCLGVSLSFSAGMHFLPLLLILPTQSIHKGKNCRPL